MIEVHRHADVRTVLHCTACGGDNLDVVVDFSPDDPDAPVAGVSVCGPCLIWAVNMLTESLESDRYAITRAALHEEAQRSHDFFSDADELAQRARSEHERRIFMGLLEARKAESDGRLRVLPR